MNTADTKQAVSVGEVSQPAEPIKKGLKPYLMVAAGVICLIVASVVYAWATLSVPIVEEFVWGKSEISIVFTLVMICFCLGGFTSGKLIKRTAPGNMLIAAGLFYLFGLYLSSIASGMALMIFGFSILGGFGAGFIYNSVLSSVTPHFPENRGLVSGILMVGFGAGSFLIGKLFQTFTPATEGAWRFSFQLGAIAFFLILFVLSFLFRDRLASRAVSEVDAKRSLSLGQMLKQSEFWLFFFWAITMSSTGLISIAQVAGLARATDPAVAFSFIATLGGLAALSNGIGRVAIGQIYDSKGRKAAANTVNFTTLFSLGLVVSGVLSHSLPLLTLGMAGFGFAYGGVPPSTSAFVAKNYGPLHFSENFSVVTLNLIGASLISSFSGFLFDHFGNYSPTFILILICTLTGLVLSAILRKRERD